MPSSYPVTHGFHLVPTHTKPLLLRRPIPIAKEGFGEYLTRLCSDNCLGGPKALAQRLGLTYGQLVELGPEAFRQILCGHARLDFPEPGEVLTSIPGKVMFMRGVRTQTRVCPLCLADGDVADKSWSWPLTLACEQHGTWLLDRCPRCSYDVSLLRRRQFCCDCGFDYRSARMQQAEPWLEHFYDLFSRYRFCEPPDGGVVYESDHRSHLILRGLLTSHHKELDAKMGRVTGDTPALVQSDQLGELREMMQNWSVWIPKRIERIAEINIASARSLIRQMRTSGSSALRTVAIGVSKAIDARRKDDSIQRRLGDPVIRSIQELTRITGLDCRTIKVFIAKGYIRGCSFREGDAGNRSFEISEEESERIRQFYSSSLSLSEVSQLLDSDVLHIKIFAKADVLRPVQRYSTHVGTWRFSKDSLDPFLASLQEIAAIVTKDTELAEFTPLGKLAVKNIHGCSCASWVRLAGRIASGEIAILRLDNGRGLNAFAVRNSDLPRAPGKS